MPSIVTITFNPCIDKSVTAPVLIPEKKMRCSFPMMDPGGGGVNVARAINRLGGDVTAVYLAGGYHGKILTRLLAKEQVPSIPVQINNETRESWIVVENSTRKQFRFVMPGPVVRVPEWQLCLSKLESLHDMKFIVVSGSMTEGIPENIFERIGMIAKKKNAKLVVDSSGDALICAVTQGAYLIKPSLHELASLTVAFNLSGQSITAAAQDLIARGFCEVVVVSMGAGGALLVTKDIVNEFQAPTVETRSTVGAGDSMVAGIVFGLVQGKSIEEAVRYGIACGSAATINPGTELCHREDAERLYKTIQESMLDVQVQN